jgi:ribosomal protein S18 acetylase RimI-like enzyme
MVKLLPASTLDMSALAELFNAGFSEYLVPMSMDESGLREYVDTNAVDLECSRIAVEEQAVAFTLIARRGTDGWVAGMGTVPSQRKRGVGAQVLLAGIEAARAVGSRTVSLEVIDRNEPAIRLYRKLGFEPVRELLVWLLAPNGTPAPTGRTVEPDVAHAWIVRHRHSREPWQRADETVAAVRARGSAKLGGLVIERDGEVRAAALVVERGDQVSVLQIAALDAQAASDAVLAAADGHRGVRLTNVLDDDPASTAMRELGAELVARQHEMLLRL